ncbi:MAG: YggS family pyridoxal phosphate-dependent enzyme [Alphaproteobacteria bacterium]|nr:YggS family pyridoxal phosphate-dependent enzyme [Alphaproteobacteria bacterium]
MTIASNLAEIRARIGKAKLIAVSKFHPEEAVREALDGGQRVFGENYVKEAQEKFRDLRAEYPDIELHLIGHLQKNKAKAAVEIFDVIQTLDSRELAKELAKALQETGKRPSFYIEVKFGDEPKKTGIAPTVTEIGSLLAYSRDVCGLNVVGLMCIPPEGENPQSYFKKLKELADILSLSHISMGMSGDYEKAIERGATEVRIGTAIFGPRPSHF